MLSPVWTTTKRNMLINSNHIYQKAQQHQQRSVSPTQQEYKHIVGKHECACRVHKVNTWKPSFTVSSCLIGSEKGRFHLFGSHKIVLLNANPDISTWNLRSFLLFSFVCHPITLLPLHTGPSSVALFLFCASIATGHVPKRLQDLQNIWHEEILQDNVFYNDDKRWQNIGIAKSTYI